MERLLDYQRGRDPITRQKLWLLSSVSASKESVSVSLGRTCGNSAAVHTCTFLVLDFAQSVYTTPHYIPSGGQDSRPGARWVLSRVGEPDWRSVEIIKTSHCLMPECRYISRVVSKLQLSCGFEAPALPAV